MKNPASVLSLRAVFVVLVLLAASARADEFLALPGLWLTTQQIEPIDKNDKSAPPGEWHCVDEDADPWIAFAQLPETLGESCARTSFERTGTTLKWQLDCRAPWPVGSNGSIVFDSPQHYTGTVTLSGRLLNYPLHDVVRVEGTRRAACTSPKD